nr:hypothetical protein [Tanacetum cinerariifolium]
VMANPVIPISSDSSDESVGSYVTRVIIFGAILAIIHVPIVPTDPFVALEVGEVYVISPTRVLDMMDYSSSSSDPSEVPYLQHQSYHWFHLSCVLMTQRRTKDWVTSRPSSPSGSSAHDTFAPSSEFPVAPVVAPPRICQWPAILIRPGEAIPFGLPYRTHPNRPHKLLTIRKRVGPFPARRLAWRRISHRSSNRHSSEDFSSDSSSSSSSLDSSSDTSSCSPLD